MSTYPYWDTDHRYMVAGPDGKETVYAWVLQHPSGFWRWRCGCGGGSQNCPIHFSGYYNDLPTIQSAVQSHLQNEHYIVPPP